MGLGLIRAYLPCPSPPPPLTPTETPLPILSCLIGGIVLAKALPLTSYFARLPFPSNCNRNLPENSVFFQIFVENLGWCFAVLSFSLQLTHCEISCHPKKAIFRVMLIMVETDAKEKSTQVLLQ